jgi:hypothetical protein
MSQEIEKVRQVKQKHEKDWLKIPEIAAIGIGNTSSGKIGIVISLKTASAMARQQIPQEVDGIPIEVNISGEIRAL